LHAYGNALNIPYNFDDADSDLADTESHVYAYFEKILSEAPEGAVLGNKAQNRGRSVNGEVSDWMFGQHNILALSADLGVSDIKSMTYFI
jgi:hypothetical protein